MRTKESSTDELSAAVDALKGMKPAEIAAMIGRRKIKGRPGTTGRCPLAVLMHGAHGGEFVVGQKFVIRRTGKTFQKMRTPENLAAFVRMFDRGGFPDLIQMPPRCMPTRVGQKGPNSKSGPSGLTHKRAKVKLHLARMADRFARTAA